jgi:hypothetical protein
MGTSSGTYTQLEQIYCLSFSANSAFGLSMPSLTDLQTYVTEVTTQVLSSTETQQYIGTDWVAVWGTQVYSNQPNNALVVVDNAMGLFYSPSQNLFVVAIAGTNGNSTYDWFSEDFDVRSTQLWQDVLGTGGVTVPNQYQDAAISAGAYQGFQILTAMQDANGHTMLQALTLYLTNNAISGATVAVAGHSLAGALCPVLALYMYQIQQNDALNWNTGGAVTTISAYPTAGPTPGETNFASYYASVVTASSGAFTYTSQYNSMDVVPQAWMLSSMETVPSIYDGSLSTAAAPFMGPITLGMLAATVDLGTATAIAYTQVEPRTVLQGTFDSLVDTGTSLLVSGYLSYFSSSTLATYTDQATSVACFLAQMVHQHTTAYSGANFLDTGLLGIGAFIYQYGKIKKSVSGGTSAEDIHNQALAQLLGKYIQGITPAAVAHLARQQA